MVSREDPAEEGALRADVLGRLLVVQQALDVLPNEEEIAGFLCRALSEVPGVDGACLALEGRPIVARSELEDACVKARGTGVGLPGDSLPFLPGSAAYPVRTVRRSFGMLALALREPGAFDPYRPVVSKIVGTIAAALETRELLRITAAARDQLEALVETRTSELAERTERLVAEMAERERATAALSESEERLRLVAANAQDAIVLLDEAGRVTMWNPAAERIFERRRSEMIGQDLHEAVAPARYLDAFRRGFAAFGRYGIGPFVGKCIELTAVRPSGAEFPVEVSVSPVRVRGQWHAIGIARDVSERKRGDTVRDALAAIVRSTTDAVVGNTPAGIVTSWNAGAARLYGYSAEEMIGHPLAVLAPSGKADEVLRLTELARTGQVVEDYETQRVHKDGRLLDVSLTLAPIRDNAGVVVGVSTIARDVTRRKRAERALRESEARLEEAQRIAHLGSWEWSIRDGSLDYSEEALRIYGIESRSAVGTFAASLERIRSVDRPAVVAALQEVLEGRSPLSVDFRIVKPGGAVRHVLGTAKVVRDASGRPARVVGTVQDVTERREAELALRRTNRSLRTLSSCNQTLVRATSETELLEGMCSILVEEGGFQRAWVGLAAAGGPGLVPAACSSRGTGGEAWNPDGVLAPGSPGGEVASLAASSREPRLHLGTPLGTGHPNGVVDGSGPGPGAIAAVPLLQEARLVGVLVLHADEPDTFDEEEMGLVSELAGDLAFGIEVLRARSERKEAAREKQKYLVQIRQNLEETVATIAATVEARDPYTAGHQRRVAAFAAAIAREIGLDEDAVQGIHLAGTIHDLGKIKVPAEILARPGQLSEIEERIIQIHPEAGWEILKGVEFPWPIAEMVLQHHERLDGSGYPQGLRGEQISLGARILGVADVVEAMASHRPYRPARGLTTALAQVESDRAVLFDATVVDACLALFREKGYRFED